MADQTLHSMTEDTDPTTTAELYLLEDPSGTPLNRRITAANLLKVTNNLTEDSTPARSTDFVATYDASASGMKKVQLQNVGGYTLFGSTPNNSPADATTYFFGGFYSLGLSTSGATRKIRIPRAGVIRRVDLDVAIAGAGSAETSTVSVRLNNTTDSTITSSFACNASGATFSNSSMSVTVAAGDYVEIKWVTPTWATNPTGVYLDAIIWVA